MRFRAGSQLHQNLEAVLTSWEAWSRSLTEQVGFGLFGEGGLDDACTGCAQCLCVGQCQCECPPDALRPERRRPASNSRRRCAGALGATIATSTPLGCGDVTEADVEAKSG